MSDVRAGDLPKDDEDRHIEKEWTLEDRRLKALRRLQETTKGDHTYEEWKSAFDNYNTTSDKWTRDFVLNRTDRGRSPTRSGVDNEGMPRKKDDKR